MNGITRVKTPEGGLLVTATTKIPKTLRDPHDRSPTTPLEIGMWTICGSEPSIVTPLLDTEQAGNDYSSARSWKA